MTAAIPTARRDTGTLLTLLTVWHAVLGITLIIAAVYVAITFVLPGGSQVSADRTLLNDALFIAATAVLLALGVASLIAAVRIPQRNHSGRALSLAVNYLGFVACLLGLSHVLGLFLGLDDLADTMARGIPFLLAGGFVVSYFISSYERRDKPVSPSRRTLGRILMAAFGVAFLLSAGLIVALASIPGKFTGPLPFVLLLGLVIFGFMTWVMVRRPTAAVMGAKNIHSERLNGWLFLSPNLLGFLIFFAAPLLFSLYVSFTNWDAFKQRDWIGLANYQKILNVTAQPLASPNQLASDVIDVKVYDELVRGTIFGNSFVVGAEDKLFWLSLRNTIVFGLLAVPLSVIPAILLAVLLNSKLPGMRVYRTIYFIPSVAAVVGIALVWKWMYDSQVGWINYFISSAINFINGLLGTTIKDPQIRWVADSDFALLAVVIMSAWQWIGFNTILFVAGLQTIPRELYEAATVDGANGSQQFWKITLPMLAPTTLFVLTTTTIQSLQAFEQIFILTNPPGGPDNATLTMVLNLYQNGFQSFRQGYASALAWVLFILIFVFTLVQFRRQRASAGAYDT